MLAPSNVCQNCSSAHRLQNLGNFWHRTIWGQDESIFICIYLLGHFNGTFLPKITQNGLQSFSNTKQPIETIQCEFWASPSSVGWLSHRPQAKSQRQKVLGWLCPGYEPASRKEDRFNFCWQTDISLVIMSFIDSYCKDFPDFNSNFIVLKWTFY